MGDVGDYWREHRDYQQDVKNKIVRCNECNKEAQPDRYNARRHYCRTCKRTFKTPQWALPASDFAQKLEQARRK